MKILKYCSIIIVAFLFLSCDKETEGVSRTTYYVDIELKDGSTVFWPMGTSFADPGYSASEQGQDVTSTVTVSGAVNSDKPGSYSLRYSVLNSDGYPKEAVRAVYVYDPAASPLQSAIYTSTKESYRNSSGTVVNYNGNYSVAVFQEEPGIFYITDFLGGWYAQRAGYGSGYDMTGRFKLNADNTIELIESIIDGWGDSLDAMTNGKYDPETGSIYWEVEYAGSMTFYITLTK